MTLFAALVLDPASIAAWIVVGLVTGWVAGKVTEPPTYGLIGDILSGTLGALVGGELFALFGPASFGFAGPILGAVGGAVLLIAVARGIAAYQQS